MRCACKTGAAWAGQALTDARNQLLAKANSSPVIAYAMMEGLADAPQLRLDIDRQKAEALGVGFDTISTAISSAYGSATVNDFANAGRLQRVVVQADVRDRMTPESILMLNVPNKSGGMVPLSRLRARPIGKMAPCRSRATTATPRSRSRATRCRGTARARPWP